MQLTIVGILPTLNKYINSERTNRFMAAKIKKDATEMVGWQVKNAQKVHGLADYTFTWYVPNRRSDPDNVSFGQKFIFDALVVNGIIPNDNMRYVRSLTHFFEVGEPRVVVEIEEC